MLHFDVTIQKPLTHFIYFNLIKKKIISLRLVKQKNNIGRYMGFFLDLLRVFQRRTLSSVNTHFASKNIL